MDTIAGIISAVLANPFDKQGDLAAIEAIKRFIYAQDYDPKAPPGPAPKTPQEFSDLLDALLPVMSADGIDTAPLRELRRVAFRYNCRVPGEVWLPVRIAADDRLNDWKDRLRLNQKTQETGVRHSKKRPANQQPEFRNETKQGPLNTTLDLTEWKAMRGKETADFAGKRYPWMIFQELCRRHPTKVSADVLRDSVWGKGEAHNGPLYAHMNKVRKLIEPLGLRIEQTRLIGYQLTEAKRTPPTKRAKGARHRRQK